jgi:hypothetical protein
MVVANERHWVLEGQALHLLHLPVLLVPLGWKFSMKPSEDREVELLRASVEPKTQPLQSFANSVGAGDQS